MLLPIKDITVLSDRQRKEMDPKKLQSLAKSIVDRQNTGHGGLIHPIVVRRPLPDDAARNGGKPVETPWVLVAGGRRLAAHVLINREMVEATIKENLPPLEQEIIELEENLERETITWQEEVAARERIHKLREKMNPRQTATQTAESLGMTKGNFSKDMHLATMMAHDPEIKSAPTKRAAMRLAEHKISIATKVLAIAETDEVDLRSKIFTADARDFIRTLKDQSIDMIFTDLPYGIDYKSSSEIGGKSHVMGQYDDDQAKVRDFVADIVPQMCRVLKPNGWMVLFFAVDGMAWLEGLLFAACATHAEYGDGTICGKEDDRECSSVTVSPMPWIWYRPNSRNISQWPDRYAKHMYETMLVVGGGAARFVVQNQPDVLVYEADYEHRLHEMQKPHDLCVDVIRRCTVPGQLVADFCFGSGAHLAAAASLGRDFIGCDNNPDNLGSAIGLVSQYYKKFVVDAGKVGLAGAEKTKMELVK